MLLFKIKTCITTLYFNNNEIVLFVQYFPGRPSVKSALKAVDGWLQEQSTEIEYSDFRDVLDSVVQVSLKTCLWFSYIALTLVLIYMDFNTDV